MSAALASVPADVAALLRGASDDDLASLYASGDPEVQAAVLAVLAEQDRKRAWRDSARGQAHAAAVAEWDALSHGEYLTAEARCPVLLSAAGQATEREAYPMLWTCNRGEFDRWASDDLKHWAEHGELSITRRGEYLAAALWTENRGNPLHEVREAGMEQDAGTATADEERAAEPGAGAVPPAHPEVSGPVQGAVNLDRLREIADGPRGREQREASAMLRDIEGAARRQARETGAPTVAGAAVAVPSAALTRRTPASPVLLTRRPRIDGAEVMEQGFRFLGHFGVWPSDETRVAAAGFVAQSHMIDAKTLLPLGEHAPHWLNISSQPGSGKTQLGKVMLALCPNGRALVEVTKPALVQHLHEGYLLMIEETDVLFGQGLRNAAIRAIINACFDPGNFTSYMHNRQKVSVALFRSLILCGLDKIEKATGEDMKALLSRCHINRLRMAPEGYRAPRFDAEARAIASMLSMRFAAWMAQEIEDGIAWDVPEMDGLPGNRPGALWETLLMAADRAGEQWPDQMREACRQAQSVKGLPGADEQASDEIEDYLARFGIGHGEED